MSILEKLKHWSKQIQLALSLYRSGYYLSESHSGTGDPKTTDANRLFIRVNYTRGKHQDWALVDFAGHKAQEYVNVITVHGMVMRDAWGKSHPNGEFKTTHDYHQESIKRMIQDAPYWMEKYQEEQENQRMWEEYRKRGHL